MEDNDEENLELYKFSYFQKALVFASQSQTVKNITNFATIEKFLNLNLNAF